MPTTVTVVIPLWNGADVIGECLAALHAHSGARLHSVIAVDNASADDGPARIARNFPQVQIIRSPFNLGFAGGVNLGLAAAFNQPADQPADQPVCDLAVLLNQDCLVDAGWLDALCAALADDPRAAIAGCTIYNPDGTVNHAGATVEHPLARARHFTDVPAAPARVEYVTGALFAIRRAAWEALGPLDAGFYPAYYEEADYCYRAAAHGWGVLYAPAASAHHLQNSRAWRADPLLHTVHQQRARYRFVAKHWAGPALAGFLRAEAEAVAAEAWLDQTLGRALAARHTLRHLDAILLRRRDELGEELGAELGADLAPADRLRLEVELGALAQTALRRSYVLAGRGHAESFDRRVRRRLHLLGEDAPHLPPAAAQAAAQAHVLALLAEYEYR